MTSGVALVAAASGIGVIVNAALAMAATPLAGSGARTLLLGGISSLLVGGAGLVAHLEAPGEDPAATPGLPAIPGTGRTPAGST